MKSFEKIERIGKVCIVFGELRPRSGKGYGCGKGVSARRRCGRGLPRAGLIVVFRQDGEASTDRMSANPRGGGAVLRKRFLDASAASVHQLITLRPLRLKILWRLKQPRSSRSMGEICKRGFSCSSKAPRDGRHPGSVYGLRNTVFHPSNIQ